MSPQWTDDEGRCHGCPVGCASCAPAQSAYATKRKVAAYDAIAKAYKLGTSEANTDRCVQLAKVAGEVRDAAMKARDEAVQNYLAIQREYPGLTATLDELFGVVDEVRLWLERTGANGTISDFNYQELASILADTPDRPKRTSQSNSPGQGEK